MLDDGLVPANPLDVWGTGADTRNLFGGCLRAMVDDPAVAVAALAVDLVTEYDGDTAYADAVNDVAKHTDAPVAVLTSVASAIDRTTADRLRDNGIPVLEGARSGLAALGHLARWPLPVERPDVAVRPQRRERWAARILEGASPFALLADYGVPVVDVRRANTLAAALAVADEIGYPVALKTVAALHKSDVGGVALDIAGEAGLNAAYTAMADSLGPGVTVEPMVEAGVEISVGIVRDQAFGPLLVVAAGGTLVELLADRAVACPPVSRAGALALLDRLRARPLLAGWRGAPPVDIDALAGVIVSFSQMAVELGDVIDAVEANPVIALPRGVVAVDALVVSRQVQNR
jgi:acetate---CoA ligase (ADP-forming)